MLSGGDSGRIWNRPEENPKKPKKPSGLSGNPKKPKKPHYDNEYDNDILKENNKKKSYGKYQWVKLTDTQYDKLIKDYGEKEINTQIDLLDEYVQSNNNKNKYTDFNLVLRRSIRENWFNKSKVNNNDGEIKLVRSGENSFHIGG